jgi:hypothetical protein
LLVRVAGVGLLALGAYLTTLTIARAGVLALGVAVCVLAASAWRAAGLRRVGTGGATIAAIALLAVAAAMAVGLSGGYLQKRLFNVEEDWALRTSHWEKALAMRDPDWSTTLFGMGLGRFPEAYLWRSGAPSLPGTYRFAAAEGNRYLSLGGGETLYMAQRVGVTNGHRYTLTLRSRTTAAGARLGVPVCEKNLLNSYRCQWNVLAIPADGAWHSQTVRFDSRAVGAGIWLVRRPVELSLYNETEGAQIDVDDVQLRDAAGSELVRNGDFSAGSDYWFFKTHSHLPWHIKNLWIAVLFEQGWFGLASFVLLAVALIWRLAPGVWRGDQMAAALLASIAGFLTVGLFGSLFDTPRIATLFFTLVALTATRTAAQRNSVPVEAGATAVRPAAGSIQPGPSESAVLQAHPREGK